MEISQEFLINRFAKTTAYVEEMALNKCEDCTLRIKGRSFDSSEYLFVYSTTEELMYGHFEFRVLKMVVSMHNKTQSMRNCVEALEKILEHEGYDFFEYNLRIAILEHIDRMRALRISDRCLTLDNEKSFHDHVSWLLELHKVRQ